MNYLPDLKTVMETAKSGEYNILPVSCEILSDVCTPIEALRKLKNISSHCYLLESVAEKEKWGRYTFLGFNPKLEITCSGKNMKIGDVRIETNDPSEQIRRVLAEYRSPVFSYLPPFTGGLAGYFSYDFLKYSEPSVDIMTEDSENFKDIDLMLFDKVKEAFKNGKTFIPFITCGFPDIEATEKIVRAAAGNGADLIELGIPFSDPTAEGPVIQGANIQALAGGVTTDMIFDLARKLRKDIKIPFVFMTYANVVFSYGAEKFIGACAETGVDGIILPDLPFEEKKNSVPYAKSTAWILSP